MKSFPHETKTQSRLSRPLFLAVLACLALGISGLPCVLAESPTPSPTPTPAPAAYPLSAIINEADATSKTLAQIQETLGDDNLSGDLRKFLPKVTDEITHHSDQTARALRVPVKIGTLQKQITGWKVVQEEVSFRNRLLNDKLVGLDADTAKLATLTQNWKLTQQEAEASDAPPDLLKRIADIQAQLAGTVKAITAKRTSLLTAQSQLADQNARITAALAQLEDARSDAVDRLLARDSRPLWDVFRRSGSPEPPLITEADFAAQWAETKVFLHREIGLIALLMVAGIAFVAVFYRIRTRAAKWMESDPALRRSVAIFEVPLATGSLLGLCLAYVMLPGAPPLLDALLGIAILIPLLRIMPHLIQPPLLLVTKALALLYFVSQLREMIALFPVLHRLLFLTEVVGGSLFTLWLIKASRFADKPDKGRTVMWRAVRAGARVSLLVFIVSGVANVFGYVNFSLFLGTVALNCAYLALLIYAATQIALGLVSFLLKVPPFSLLAIVSNHRILLYQRLSWFLRVAAFLIWLLFALEKSSLLVPVTSAVSAFLSLPLVANITPGNFLAFILTIWASFLISRFVRFVLEEDVYLRVHLKPGLPFAISTLLHYAILLLGFYIAMAALMGDISKFTILAGAFGVGIGFGLQNIVNNFVSSLIVLFERPVKIGDQVEIGTLQGTVRRIGIRATVIRTSAGSEIIIPNGKLISDPVTNWNLTHHQRLLQIEVATASAGVDPAAVVEVLEKAAATVESVSSNPAPQAIVSKIAAASFLFELRVWTPESSNLSRIRSNVTIAVNNALAAHQIPLA